MSLSRPPSVYDRMCWPEGQLELALAGGAHRRELRAYMGAREYQTLTALAREAAAIRPRANAATVYLLPGILGSQLGKPRGAREPVDLLWLDPDDIVDGRLTELHPQHADALQPLGVVVYSYLALKLRLAAAGMSVVLHDYDWRDDVLASGRALAARLQADPAEALVLVGHSMGGLLARAALAQCDPHSVGKRVQQVIGLGAPQGGSIAAAQALRATYPVVCRLAAIDRLHDAQTLTTDVFRQFLSLYQMLPKEQTLTSDKGALNLYESSNWPQVGPGPDPLLLHRAREFDAHLAPVDERFVSIVGTGQRTATGIERRQAEFVYQISSAGDGTVAIDRASLPGSKIYSLRCEHSELPRSTTVAQGIVELIHHGATRRLTAGVTANPGHVVRLTDSVLRAELNRKQDWHGFTVRERRRYLDRISAAPKAYRSPRARPPGTRARASEPMQKL
jgi:Palmitoyl protein thioesterase